MKNLGGISIDFIEHDWGYGTAIKVTVKGVPGKVIATELVSVAARIERKNPRFMEDLIDKMEELMGMEDETEDESGITEQ